MRTRPDSTALHQSLVPSTECCSRAVEQTCRQPCLTDSRGLAPPRFGREASLDVARWLASATSFLSHHIMVLVRGWLFSLSLRDDLYQTVVSCREKSPQASESRVR